MVIGKVIMIPKAAKVHRQSDPTTKHRDMISTQTIHIKSNEVRFESPIFIPALSEAVPCPKSRPHRVQV